MSFKIDFHHGTPAVFENGTAVTGLMHWTRTPTPEDAKLFRDAGIHFFSFMGNLSVAPDGKVPEEELEIRDGGLQRMLLTPENIDSTMRMLTSIDPQIRILPRIIMNPPLWWERKHPEELMLYYNYNTRSYVRGPRACLASGKWNAAWMPALRETISYFEKKWGDFIFGYHTGVGHCGEHDYQWWDHAADFSEGHLRAFRVWLKKKYTVIEELNRVWRSDWHSFDEIPHPDGARFADFGPRANAIFLPETESDLIDFQKFASDQMADILLLESKTVKSTLRELGREKLYGAFYGYINLVANSTQTTVGHSALTKVLESPDVDFICGPLSYGARQNGGCVLPQMIPGSIRIHGKVFYNEDDTGTHVVHCSHHGYIPATAEDSIHAERRNFLETWQTGGTQWWMDLYGNGWFLDENLKKEFEFLNRFAGEQFNQRKSHAQIAVFVSLESALYMRDNPLPLTGNLIEHQLFEIAASGAPYDLYQDEDIPLLAKAGLLDQYKVCIFPNNLFMKEEIRADVDRLLKKNGRTLLWFYAPGYIRNHNRSAAFSEELTGIRFHAVENGIMPMLTETWIDGLRIAYGLSRAVYPRLTADDSGAEELGYYINGTTIAGYEYGSGAAFVKKDFKTWKSIWSSSPGLPSAILGRMFEDAGVHRFGTRGDPVFFAENWIGIHAKCTGPLRIALPGKFQIRDRISGQEYPAGNRIDLETKRGRTYLFVLQRISD